MDRRRVRRCLAKRFGQGWKTLLPGVSLYLLYLDVARGHFGDKGLSVQPGAGEAVAAGKQALVPVQSALGNDVLEHGFRLQ
ncbi:hypothetical protein D3C86_1895500 [compost metagenome]